jgi:hypothetical protein
MRNMATDHRQSAHGHVDTLIARLRARPDHTALQPLVEECEALARAIAAFHMEGIRFRIYNVDRLVHKDATLAAEVGSLVAEARKELEAAGFHTRSHQAPGA